MIFETEHCLYCHNSISANFNWGNFFLGGEKQLLCEKCESQLKPIEGDTCKICYRPLAELDEKFYENNLCMDCIRWENSPKWKGILERNISLFEYNDFLKELIAQYKYRGDYVLATILAKKISHAVKKLSYDLVVPIPLSKERLYERGFNQAEAIAKEAHLSIANILTRIHSEKQSKKTREERIHLEQVFTITESKIALKDKKILIIDDIYTTGSTIRHAALVLKKAGAKRISSLTIARG